MRMFKIRDFVFASGFTLVMLLAYFSLDWIGFESPLHWVLWVVALPALIVFLFIGSWLVSFVLAIQELFGLSFSEMPMESSGFYEIVNVPHAILGGALFLQGLGMSVLFRVVREAISKKRTQTISRSDQT